MRKLLLILVLVGCGGGGGTTHSVCGNSKVEPGEDCDNGTANGMPGNGCNANCTFNNIMLTGLQVTWFINQNAAPQFDSEACFTVADSGYMPMIRVTLSGPNGVSYTDEYPCSPNVKLYADQASKPIPAGDYMITGRMIEREQAPGTGVMDLTQDVTVMASVTSMHQTNSTVNFPYDKFINQNRQGNLFFETTGWQQTDMPDAAVDGSGMVLMGCSAAGVMRTRFFLRRMGQPVTAMTTMGLALDGTPTDCTGPSNKYTVQNLPWGPYDLVVGGYANQGASQLLYCSSIPVFVGAGSANPTYLLTAQATSASNCP